jgi:hypothetical protein
VLIRTLRARFYLVLRTLVVGIRAGLLSSELGKKSSDALTLALQILGETMIRNSTRKHSVLRAALLGGTAVALWVQGTGAASINQTADFVAGIDLSRTGGPGAPPTDALVGIECEGFLCSSRLAIVDRASTPGGEGLSGPAIAFRSADDIVTSGFSSPGILAISAGGPGGRGGNGAGGVRLGNPVTGGTLAEVGGQPGRSGGPGGSGGPVDIENDGFLRMTGVESIGIAAISNGGRGGNGGSDNAALQTGGYGGPGGPGGIGGEASAINRGTVQTTRDFGHALFVLSQGGDSGDAGEASQCGVFGLCDGNGGTSRQGGDGGSARSVNTGQVSTTGKSSFGMYVQSIGGGGGQGGDGRRFPLIGSAKAGNGAASGKGGSAIAENEGTISTTGEDAIGIYARSIGGGAGSAGAGRGLVLGVGGDGGRAGNGGEVTVSNTGTLSTGGARAHGVLAQSIGGGGGRGGEGSSNFNVGGQGGVGGAGGDAKTVIVSNSGLIQTGVSAVLTGLGDFAHAVFAQSIGGGGGDGGNAQGQMSIGGNGKSGGKGGKVQVNNTGELKTYGNGAHAAFAQSIGGGGGNGGRASSIGAFLAVGIGGKGEAGGAGDTVAVSNSGRVATQGNSSFGVFAQSIGGGGGNGGDAASGAIGAFASISVAIGGQGGAGGAGGSVSVVNSADAIIETAGKNALGILAQSVGGGGGSSGSSLSISVAGGPVGVAGALSFGGSCVTGQACAGGDGAAVDIFNDGRVITHGDLATALVAQSVGGGGGNGGRSISFAAGVGEFGGAIGVSMGGKGGKGGVGKDVQVVNNGLIETLGNSATGVLAQSVGGGGGNGGDAWSGNVTVGGTAAGVSVTLGGDAGAGSTGGTVKVTNTKRISTKGASSQGIVAQSVGGGGGNGGSAASLSVSASSGTSFSLSAALGGTGGNGGDANLVRVDNTAQIETGGKNSDGSLFGAGSHGIIAQSIGGGGGNGGSSFAGALSIGSSAVPVSLSIGGSGEVGGNGGEVWVSSLDSLVTHGADAFGIFAQSVGGGGGNGGVAISASEAFGSSNSVPISFSLGGSGKAGGEGKLVDITIGGLLMTEGDRSHAIFAQSVGGGGGSGGASVSQTLTTPSFFGGTQGDAVEAKVSIGGAGDGGGSGGNVNALINSGAKVITKGNGAYGIFAESVGGGGGNGGTSGFSTDGNAKKVDLTVSVGGNGGVGGVGRQVNVTNYGLIETLGANAHAVYAHSVGGGGGNGGKSENNAIADAFNDVFKLIDVVGADASTKTLKSAGEVNVKLQIGGAAGDGAIGGLVHIDNFNEILTRGFKSHGVFAQSVGGGGGSGGAVTSPITGLDTKFTFNFDMGGRGGRAQDGGLVEVTNHGVINVLGDQSRGIFAQSIGGGGGDGGGIVKVFSSYTDEAMRRLSDFGGTLDGSSLALNASIGGRGGVAGDGKHVDVKNYGQINTYGKDARAISAQSIGGGGGGGGSIGFENYAAIANNKLQSWAETVSDQKKRIEDANAQIDKLVKDCGSTFIDTCTSLTAELRSKLTDAGALFGGVVKRIEGLKINDFTSFKFSSSQTYSLSVGGSAGASGDGGRVDVLNEGNIHTRGANSIGIFAQSIGGGGGETPIVFDKTDLAGLDLSGGNGGGANVDPYKELKIGSADGSSNYSLMLGGFGGAGGDGKLVKIINNGSIILDGDNSKGIFAQSVGGGGGIVGASPLGGEKKFLQDTIKISGIDRLLQDGASGNGGDIDITHNGNITINGDNSFGIFAQSIGAGGGAGFGLDTSELMKKFDDKKKEVQAKLEQLNQRAGQALDKKEAIKKFTDDVNAQIAKLEAKLGVSLGTIDGEKLVQAAEDVKSRVQTLIGDIGNAGVAQIDLARDTVNRTLQDAANQVAMQKFSGKGGNVTITSTGDIVVNGKNSVAFFAQSVGGRGGIAQIDDRLVFGTAGGVATVAGDGTAGIVSISHTGKLIAMGENGYGFLAQSSSDQGAQNITTELDDVVMGGTGAGAGIFLEGGANNGITIQASSFVGALSGLAIRGTSGNDAINNLGTVVGDLVLGSGQNSFLNTLNATYISDDQMDLGGGVFENRGATFLGEGADPLNLGSHVGKVVTVDGDFNQTTTGLLFSDLSFSSRGLPSDRMDLFGGANLAGQLNVHLLSLEDLNPVTLMRSVDAISDAGMVPVDTLVMDYGLEFRPQQLLVTAAADFSLPEFNANTTAIGDHLNQGLAVGGASQWGTLLAELGNLPDTAEARSLLRATLENLSPEPYLTAQEAALTSSITFGSQLFSCNRNDASRVVVSETECVWGRVDHRNMERERTAANFAYREDSTILSGGFQKSIAPNWFAGLGIGAEFNSSKTQSFGKTTGGGVHLGAMAKYVDGNSVIAGSVAGGFGNVEMDRVGQPALFNPSAHETAEMSYFSAQIRGSHQFDLGLAYVRPSLDLGVSVASLDGIGEAGAGGFGIVSKGATNELLFATPAVELGGNVVLDETYTLRPYLTVGGKFVSDGNLDLKGRFSGTPLGTSDFVISSAFDESQAFGRIGVQLFDSNFAVLKAEVGSTVGDNNRAWDGNVKVSLPF